MEARKENYIGGIQRFSTEDGPGIRTTVFIKGCPLHCAWCHNPELLEASYAVLYRASTCIGCGGCVRVCPAQALRAEDGHIAIDRSVCVHCGKCVAVCNTESLYTKANTYSMDALMAEVEKDAAFYKSSGGGVTLSGGEILLHGDYALEIAQELRMRGISCAIETSGYGEGETLLHLAALCDWILFDLKLMDIEKHRAYIGVSPERIWANLDALAADDALRKKLIIRVPMIHGVNDGDENMAALGAFVSARRLFTVNLLPYHNMGVSKGRNLGIVQEEFETPSDEALFHAKALLETFGCRVSVMGHEEET